MAGSRTTNTMSEGMVGLLQQIALLKAAPDADLDAISSLESQVLNIIKKPQQEAMTRIASAGGVVPGMTDQAGSPGGASPGGAPMGPPGMSALGAGLGGIGGGLPVAPAGYRPSGMRNGGAMPPVDELRRLIASSGVA